jgi:hypothetical protein
MLQSIVSLLQEFGVTPDKYQFLVLGVLVVTVGLWQNAKSNRIILNMKAIVTFLATAQIGQRFDSSVIEAMSPLQIKPRGYVILEKAGMTKIMEDKNNRKRILAYVREQKPETKLDVEKCSILCASSVLDWQIMTPVKKYLYDAPSSRQFFPTLPGLFIRDEYLKDHVEITE